MFSRLLAFSPGVVPGGVLGVNLLSWVTRVGVRVIVGFRFQKQKRKGRADRWIGPYSIRGCSILYGCDSDVGWDGICGDSQGDGEVWDFRTPEKKSRYPNRPTWYRLLILTCFSHSPQLVLKFCSFTESKDDMMITDVGFRWDYGVVSLVRYVCTNGNQVWIVSLDFWILDTCMGILRSGITPAFGDPALLFETEVLTPKETYSPGMFFPNRRRSMVGMYQSLLISNFLFRPHWTFLLQLTSRFRGVALESPYLRYKLFEWP